MEEKINKALSQIYTDLQNVKTASDSVDEVVNSSTQLQNKVSILISDTTNLSENMKNLVESIADKGVNNIAKFDNSLNLLKESCSNFVELMNTNSNEIISDFNKKTISLANDLKSEISELHKTSEILSSIQSKIENINTKVNEIDNSISVQQNLLNQLTQSLNAANTALSAVSPLIQSIQEKISIQNEKNTILIENKLKTIRIMVIIQFILGLLSLFLFFTKL
jgi:chromosome segregation ATPase